MYVFILSIVALISVSVLSNAMFVRRGIATPFTVALKFVPILFLAAGGFLFLQRLVCWPFYPNLFHSWRLLCHF